MAHGPEGASVGANGALPRFLDAMRTEGPLPIRIGTAGWTIRRQQAQHFMEGESVLARYGTRFGAVEINSSFYRPHRTGTYERWAASVPARIGHATVNALEMMDDVETAV